MSRAGYEDPMRRDLVQRAMAHDHEAFTELARLSIDKLYAIARLILHDTQRAEDATQEALVAAWRDIAGLRDPDRFEAWLRRLLVHACYREARRDRARRLVEVHVPALEHSVADASRDLADRDELERGFRHLAPDQRALIVLHYYLGPARRRDGGRPRHPGRDRQVPAAPRHAGAARPPRRRRARRRPPRGATRMTSPDFDRTLSDWLDARAPQRAPEHLLGATVHRTARTRPRPAWRTTERWTPMTVALRPAAFPRGLLFALVTLGLLVALAAAALYIGGRPSFLATILHPPGRQPTASSRSSTRATSTP